MTATIDPEVPDTDEPVPLRARGWGIPVLLALVAIVAVLAVGVGLTKLVEGDASSETVTYVVPKGTAEKVFFGRTVDIMPPEVTLSVGDTLVIRNDDEQTATVGPFTVRAGETLTQTFQRPQTLIGECTLSGTGEIKIVVT